MYHVTRIDESRASVPPHFEGHVRGYRRQVLVGQEHGSPHMMMAAAWLDEGGEIPSVVHSYEWSLYVMEGEVVITLLGSRIRLAKDHCLVVPVGVEYSITGIAPKSQWLQCSAPAEINPPRKDTFFTGGQLSAASAADFDLRDPRNRNAFRFDPASMDLANLAVGAAVNAPAVSASMATALLAYSGIGVRMLIDQRVGAQLHTMFMVHYQPTAIAHPHDHPFEETYVFTEGEVHGLIEGKEMVFHPGDVLWCGVGSDHGFHNRSDGHVQWIETQAPQPPAQHSYRFNRDWEYLEHKLDGHAH